MKIYHYANNTKEYIGHTTARLDPLETKLKKRNIYLYPKNTTNIKPPDCKENEKQVFNGNNWVIVPDNRKKVVYDTATKQPRMITMLGDEIKDNETDLIPDTYDIWDINTKQWVYSEELEMELTVYKRIETNFFQIIKDTIDKDLTFDEFKAKIQEVIGE